MTDKKTLEKQIRDANNILDELLAYYRDNSGFALYIAYLSMKRHVQELKNQIEEQP